MANGMVTEYNMWGIIDGGSAGSNIKESHTGVARRPRRKRIKKSEIEWFTTFVDEEDEEIVKAGITKAIKRYNKSDRIEGLLDYNFWKKYVGLSKERCDAINRALVDLVLSGEYLNKEKTIQKIMRAGGVDRNRAELIAITELANLSNLVRAIAYSRRTKVVKFKWVTENDDRVCEKCRRMAELTKDGVTLEEMKRLIKEVGGETAREWILHPRDRCAIVRAHEKKRIMRWWE